MIDLQTASRARIEKAWNSTLIAGETGTHMTASIWVRLAPAEQKRIQYLAQALINQLIEDNHLLPVNADTYQKLTHGQDAWEECEFEEYEPGDRVKAVSEDGSFEFSKPLHAARVEDFWAVFTLENGVEFKANLDTNTFFCIPAPVQHPDPKEHQYILVHRADPKYNRHMFPNVGMTSGMNGYGVGKIYIPAEHILEWEELTPAKVVAEDEPVRPEDVGF